MRLDNIEDDEHYFNVLFSVDSQYNNTENREKIYYVQPIEVFTMHIGTSREGLSVSIVKRIL